MLHIGLEDFPASRALHDHKGPIPSQPILANRVAFLPLFLGTLKNARLQWGQ
jgi:hypothetical protein